MTRKIAWIAVCALLVAPPAGSAKEIVFDGNIRVSAGTVTGNAAYTPWSGDWWAQSAGELSLGWNGTKSFEYNHTSKEYDLETGIAGNDLSPLRKYDEFVKKVTGTDPKSAEHEIKQHHIYGAKKEKYDRDRVDYSWWGHCNGWAAAAILEFQPFAPLTARGIRFDVADQKGILTSAYYEVDARYHGDRYYKPEDDEKKSYEEARRLQGTLDAGTPDDVKKFIEWYEKAFSTKVSDSRRRTVKPSSFTRALKSFADWYKRQYIDSLEDILAHNFHKLIVTVIKNQRSAVVFDITRDEAVWNYPAFKFVSTITAGGTVAENSQTLNVFKVRTVVTYADDGVHVSVIGVRTFDKTYTYKLFCKADGEIVRGEWTGGSVDDHPDFAWLPFGNMLMGNSKMKRQHVEAILPQVHKASESRLVDLKVAVGSTVTAASSRIPADHPDTVANPMDVPTSFDLSVGVGSGPSIASVSYYLQKLGRTRSVVIAERGDMELLGSSTRAAGGFAVTVAPTQPRNQQYLLVALAHDASGRVLAASEFMVKLTSNPPPTTGGGSVGTGGGNGSGTGANPTSSWGDNSARSRAARLAAGAYDFKVDRDHWFKVAAGAGQTVTARLEFQHSQGDIDLNLYTGSSTRVGDSSTSSGNVEQVGYVAGSATDVYLYVYGYRNAVADVKLTLTISGGSGSGRDPGGSGSSGGNPLFSNNHTRATAAAAAPGIYNGLQLGAQEHWFKVTVGAGGTLTVRIDFTHSSGDLDLEVFNPGASGSQLGRSTSISNSETVTKSGLAAGDYLVRVYAYRGAQNAYNLTVAVQ